MAKLYVITGPAGVGKTTVTKALAEKLERCAILEGDELYHQVYGGVSPWLEGNHVDVMWKNMLCQAKNYLNAGIDVVINYIIYKERLEQILQALASSEVHFVLLLAKKETIVSRDELRPEDVQQAERIDVHLKDFEKQNFAENFVLNTENKSVSEEVDEILSGRFLIQTAVDKGHCSGLKELYFNMVKSGEKIYELRVHDEKRQNINVGDDYVFGLEPERNQMVRKKIKNKLLFKNFSEASDKLDFKKVGFSSREEMKIVYNAIYSKEEQEKFGVVAFELE